MFGMQMIEDVNCLDTGVIVGKRPKYIKRSWKKRFFSTPLKPFQKYDLIMVPEYKPTAYIINTPMMKALLYHPAMKGDIYSIFSNNVA